jgi:hypothetical protein
MFNELEVEIFAWFKRRYPDANLAQQLDSAMLTERKWTRVGFYVYFEVDRALPKIDLQKYGGTFPISGPGIKSDDVDLGGGSLLLGKDGFLECLEMYAFGKYFNENVAAFELETH